MAVVDDDAPFLQALRFDVRPEGPELDGLVGAGALGRSRLELDYLSETPRAIFSCEPARPASGAGRPRAARASRPRADAPLLRAGTTGSPPLRPVGMLTRPRRTSDADADVEGDAAPE